eukprot:CAMPEP_0170633156 /NCGR_PEP_ID=MMETSP0224-20130122/35779_1 /TAXON_ID=285029 /ORGANISM="Togula jolla, Strain CCCM 725" /LENGTH=499 /DNA_ID=CAMNT_0010962053 /DNA_START=155 /DNA_END=1651 /DNA_ORIENTATION=+
MMNETSVWSGFTFILGFVTVFRTQQAYNRFTEAVDFTYQMGAEWFDCASSLMAFCRYSSEDWQKVDIFQQKVIRLFSMLHAAAIGELMTTQEQAPVFKVAMIDVESLDDDSLRAIRDTDCKVELIFQWIQQLMVVNVKSGVLSIPPPLLTRAFQELATGMSNFHGALKIAAVPFPFPYAQTCDCLMALHWLLVPFVVSEWVTTIVWAMAFAFLLVFTFNTLNHIAMELENPFGDDLNDMDSHGMQSIMNQHLRLLVQRQSSIIPEFKLADLAEWRSLQEHAMNEGLSASYEEVWSRLEAKGLAKSMTFSPGVSDPRARVELLPTPELPAKTDSRRVEEDPSQAKAKAKMDESLQVAQELRREGRTLSREKSQAPRFEQAMPVETRQTAQDAERLSSRMEWQLQQISDQLALIVALADNFPESPSLVSKAFRAHPRPGQSPFEGKKQHGLRELREVRVDGWATVGASPRRSNGLIPSHRSATDASSGNVLAGSERPLYSS